MYEEILEKDKMMNVCFQQLSILVALFWVCERAGDLIQDKENIKITISFDFAKTCYTSRFAQNWENKLPFNEITWQNTLLNYLRISSSQKRNRILEIMTRSPQFLLN